jgi:hypothetical protein
MIDQAGPSWAALGPWVLIKQRRLIAAKINPSADIDAIS